MLWAGSKLRDLLPESKKQELLEAVWRAQEPDGGWTLASLGPWRKRDAAPVATGSNSYATALTAFTLEQAGVPSSQPGMAKALIWLKTHQQAEGYWAAESMNHKHDAGTMPDKFMSDAATGYAVSALLDGESEPAQMTAVAKGSK